MALKTSPKISLTNLTNSRFGVAFALALARYTPRWLGYSIARNIARLIASQRSSAQVQAIRANQWVVSGETLSARDLDQRVKTVLTRLSRCLYDFYRNNDRPGEVMRLVSFSPEFQALFDRQMTGKGGALFIAPHMGNFDLGGRALALHGLKLQVLSYPQPPGGYQWQNQIRLEGGLDVTPMSISALQKAKERLRAGGVVLTGPDRPLKETRYFPRFFDRPAPLTVAYIQLALQTGVPISVVACVSRPDHTYQLVCQPEYYPQAHPDREYELVSNAEAVLKQAAELILRDPSQWAMSYPVWPEALKQVPR